MNQSKRRSHMLLFCAAVGAGRSLLESGHDALIVEYMLAVEQTDDFTLDEPFQQIEHYFFVLQIFIFFMLSRPLLPIPSSYFSRLSCSSLNCTESYSIRL